jgi:predicted NAD-dependent protein-ADP-ribosyltransferase YbiA (DUF1768 family)
MKKKIKQEIPFSKVKEPGGWLSCMSPHPVIFNGQRFKTCEALFQCRRFEGYPVVQEEIRNCPSPL